jgi:hypothetical protein
VFLDENGLKKKIRILGKPSTLDFSITIVVDEF